MDFAQTLSPTFTVWLYNNRFMKQIYFYIVWILKRKCVRKFFFLNWHTWLVPLSQITTWPHGAAHRTRQQYARDCPPWARRARTNHTTPLPAPAHVTADQWVAAQNVIYLKRPPAQPASTYRLGGPSTYLRRATTELILWLKLQV